VTYLSPVSCENDENADRREKKGRKRGQTLYSDRVTPHPIPNSAVKPCRADDTTRVHRLESLGQHQKKWWAVPTLQEKLDGVGAQAGTPAPPIISKAQPRLLTEAGFFYQRIFVCSMTPFVIY